MQMYTGTRLTMTIHRRHSFRFFSERRGGGGGSLHRLPASLIFARKVWFVGGKTHNIAIQLVLRKTRCTFLVAHFTVP